MLATQTKFFSFLWTAFFISLSRFLSFSLSSSGWPYVVASACVSFKPLTSFAAINYNYHIKRQSVLIFNYKFFFCPSSHASRTAAPLLPLTPAQPYIYACFVLFAAPLSENFYRYALPASFTFRFAPSPALPAVQRLLYDA